MSGLPPPGTLYVHYSRYSTDHQTFRSIEDQQTLCRAYAERHGWVEVRAYFDAARSGATMVGRVGLFEMLAAADRGEFVLILVDNLDRLTRTGPHCCRLLDDLKALDVIVHVIDVGVLSEIVS